MTRKHFVALADALKDAHPALTDFDTPEAREAWRVACRNVSDACKGANPAFDRSRFLAACTPAGRAEP